MRRMNAAERRVTYANTLEIFVLRGGAYKVTVSARDDNHTIVSPTLDGLTIDPRRVFAD
jgi:hypothetical protein